LYTEEAAFSSLLLFTFPTARERGEGCHRMRAVALAQTCLAYHCHGHATGWARGSTHSVLPKQFYRNSLTLGRFLFTMRARS
jgi:hypothetical protein